MVDVRNQIWDWDKDPRICRIAKRSRARRRLSNPRQRKQIPHLVTFMGFRCEPDPKMGQGEEKMKCELVSNKICCSNFD